VVGKYRESDGEPYGWWLGVIAGIDKNDFIVRWPDDPKMPPWMLSVMEEPVGQRETKNMPT